MKKELDQQEAEKIRSEFRSLVFNLAQSTSDKPFFSRDLEQYKVRCIDFREDKSDETTGYCMIEQLDEEGDILQNGDSLYFSINQTGTIFRIPDDMFYFPNHLPEADPSEVLKAKQILQVAMATSTTDDIIR